MTYDFYKTIPDWSHNEVFPYDVYAVAAQECVDGDILCEVNNAFFGKHACFMMENLAENKKKSKFYVFDMFNMVESYLDGDKLVGYTPWYEAVDKWFNRIGGKERSIDIFDFYVQQCPFSEKLTSRAQFNSWHVAHEFSDKSVFFVLVRVTESPVHTKNCLDCWYPKIRDGGRIVMYQTNTKSESKQAVLKFIEDHNLKTLSVEQDNYIQISK